MMKVTDLEANLEQFKIDQAAINSNAAEQRALLRERIVKNKWQGGKDNCFKGAHVTEVAADECGGKNLPLNDSTLKDLDTEDSCTRVGVLESANSQDSTNPTWTGDQSRIRKKDVPSHGTRK
nr:purine permease [Tanacetum cinerariifolium]